jgi:hypothetical protein
MKRVFLFVPLLLLGACTSSVAIPADKYGVLLRFGEIKEAVQGPAMLDKAFAVEHVILINKEYSIKLNNDQYLVRYQVVDPKRYFLLVHGNGSILELVEKELARQSLQGKAVASEAKLHALIESMKLPIRVERTQRAG